MFDLPLSVRLRLGTLVLLTSLLPLAVQAPAPAGTQPVVEPAAWLKAQVKEAAEASSEGSAQEDFDQALAEAEAADAATLHDFLTAFLDAHARLTATEAPVTEGRTARALVQTLQQQLEKAGLIVRSPAQASMPPAGPRQLVRWVGTSILVPFPDRLAVFGVAASRTARSLPMRCRSVLQATVVCTRGTLLRVLFAGRRLGP